MALYICQSKTCRNAFIKRRRHRWGNGYFIFSYPKEDKYKEVKLTQEDHQIILSFPPALPDIIFFRHSNGQPFGQKMFRKWWERACDNLGIEGVSLYPGTRHSSVRALKEHFTRDQIKNAAGSATNKAFERYYGNDVPEEISVYEKAGTRGKIARFKKAKSGNEMAIKYSHPKKIK